MTKSSSPTISGGTKRRRGVVLRPLSGVDRRDPPTNWGQPNDRAENVMNTRSMKVTWMVLAAVSVPLLAGTASAGGASRTPTASQPPPVPAVAASLVKVTVNPTDVVGGAQATGIVTLTSAAAVGGFLSLSRATTPALPRCPQASSFPPARRAPRSSCRPQPCRTPNRRSSSEPLERWRPTRSSPSTPSPPSAKAASRSSPATTAVARSRRSRPGSTA